MSFEGINRSIYIRASSFVFNLFLLNTILVLGTILSFGVMFIPITVGIMYLFRKIINRENYYFWKDFYKGLKQNIKISIILSLLFNLLAYLLWLNINLMKMNGEKETLYLILSFIIGYGMFIIWIYGSAIIARFEVKIFRTIYFAFLIGNSHLFSTITCIIFLVLICSLYNLINYLFLFIFMSVYLYFVSFIVFKILKRYEPK